ncbi:alpha/beta hydrolase [Maricaulis sp.]|uniref:alpha/beta fold hydrolase n=1 Tax=Maricaulis sp. TaxID=1486257 RepID=UPI002614D056|nr:alpha/beta hydrolase [Maricaulis sp.]
MNFAVMTATLVGAASLLLNAQAEAQTHFDIERAGNSEARSVLFIPGLATPGDVWDGTVAALGDTVDAHIVTADGFGGPARVSEGPFVAPVAAELAAYLEQENVENAVLVGHSMGAQIALQVAAQAPGRIDEVVVVDSVPFYARLFNAVATPEQAGRMGQQMQAQLEAMSHEQFMSMSRQGVAIQATGADDQEQILSWMAAADQGAIARAMGEVTGSDYSAVLQDVDARITVLAPWSEASPVPADVIASMYERQYPLENASVHMIADSRHFIMLDQPEAFMAILRQQLAD